MSCGNLFVNEMQTIIAYSYKMLDEDKETYDDIKWYTLPWYINISIIMFIFVLIWCVTVCIGPTSETIKMPSFLIFISTIKFS